MFVRWVDVGPVKGGSTNYCAAGSQCAFEPELAGGSCGVSEWLVGASVVGTWDHAATRCKHLQTCPPLQRSAGRRNARSSRIPHAPDVVGSLGCIAIGFFPMQKCATVPDAFSCGFPSLASCSWVGCKRDYQELCPKAWTQMGSEQKCKPDAADYNGPCRRVHVLVHVAY